MSRTVIVATLCVCVLGALIALAIPLGPASPPPAPQPRGASLVLPRAEMPRKVAVIALLRERQYTELEEIYGLTLATDQQSATDDLARFAAFAYADPALEGALNGWAAARESSPLPFIARGRYYLHLGYTVRGERSLTETSDDQIEEMRRFFDLARKDFRTAIEIGPPTVAAHEGLISIAVTTGDRAEADAVLERALAATDHPVPLHLAYMRGLEPQWGGGRRGGPLRYWSKLQRSGTLRHSDRYLAFVVRILQAEEACRVNACKDALDHYEQAAEVMPERVGIIGHARALAALQRYDEALEILDAGLQLDPDSVKRHELKTIILAGVQRYDEALASIEAAVALNPYDPELLWWRRYVLGELLTREDKAGNWAQVDAYGREIRHAIERALVYGAGRPDIQLVYGRMLLAGDGPREDGYEALRVAIRLAPDDPEYILNYGNALAAVNDCKALPVYQSFEKACKKNGSCGQYLSMDVLTNWLEERCDTSDEARQSRIVSEALAWMESCGEDYKAGDSDSALARCTQKAEAGDAAAAFDLGLIYNGGYGVDFDERKAIHWWEIAVERGHRTAKVVLGNAVYQGSNTEQDIERGRRLIREAAEAGDITAMYALGMLYLRGMYDDQDVEEAHRWILQAADLGSEEARRALKRLFGKEYSSR